jgi:signal transduction histidine kinase
MAINGVADAPALGSLHAWQMPASAPPEPLFVRDRVRPFGEDIVIDPPIEPELAAAEAEPEVAPEAAVQPAEDLSYVALALGAGAGFAAATVRQAAVPAIDTEAAIQSETAATTADGDAVAASATASQGHAMLERSETLVADPETVEPITDGDAALIASAGDQEGPFQIADVVARIDAFWRNREQVGQTPRAMPRADGFRFETDPEGVIRWVDGVSRNPVIGLSLELHGAAGVSRVDGVAAGAFRRRANFTNARMEIEGDSDAAGGWLISGVPVFDAANGRFTGYRGTARRPRTDERAEPLRPAAALAPDSLRQLVHELRTPTNAIAGFAEMIESEMLGPVPDGYRDRAATIRGQARDLLGAIDDLDLAARIESAALSLAPAEVALRPLLATICDDLAQLTAIRGSWIALPIDNLAVRGDRRAVERLLSRLMATLVSASADGERIGVRLARDADAMVAISIDRPHALADYPGESMLGIDDEGDDVTLLGTGFALRLARNLARELGGSMVIEPENLTLRLPAPEDMGVEQAHLN